MDKDKLNKHVLDTALEILTHNEEQEALHWNMNYNDAIDRAIKTIQTQAKAFGVEQNFCDIDEHQIWLGLQKART